MSIDVVSLPAQTAAVSIGDAAAAMNRLNAQQQSQDSNSGESDGERTPGLEEHTVTANGDAGVSSVNGSKSKKKKKRKSKKSSAHEAANASADADGDTEAAQIRIARNKHMRFISSYHGPWLQLPTEILDSLLQLNCDPAALAAASEASSKRERDHTVSCRACSTLDAKDLIRTNALGHTHTHPISPLDELHPEVDESSPPPIDPAVFRGTLEVRKLIDMASDLAVRAASGLSAAALGALATSSANSGGSVAAALGLENTINGRSAAMSSTRQHRLRVMAVSKLAQAYSIDEVAASVAVMQGATAIDDVADKVLRHDAGNPDALLVSFFHEKIPSAPSIARTHAQQATRSSLDHLIQRYPERLNYFRSLGIWQTFKQDYQGAIHTFSVAIVNAKALRHGKSHRSMTDKSGKGSKKRKGKGAGASHHGGHDLPATAVVDASQEDEDEDEHRALMPRLLLPMRARAALAACPDAADIGLEAGDDTERQIYFFRGMAHFQLASTVLENKVFGIEKVIKPPGGLSNEAGELTLEGVGLKMKPEAKSHMRGMIVGSAPAGKLAQYQTALGSTTPDSARAEIMDMLTKSTEDFKHFLSYFAVWDASSSPHGYQRGEDHRPSSIPNQHLVRSNSEKSIPFRGRKLIHHRSLNGRTRYTDPRTVDRTPQLPPLLTTYHPLLIEAHFSLLLNLLLLGDFTTLLEQHYRVARLMDHLEGYPVFVPARSLNQSEYAELLELLAESWLVSREANGYPTPALDGSEDEIYARGPLPCLQHLASYFSEAHNTRIEEAAEIAEKEATAATASALKARKPRSLLEKRMLEEAQSGEALDHDLSSSSQAGTGGAVKAIEGPPYHTARAEVALAWLQTAIIPQLEAEEEQMLATESLRPGSSASNVPILGSSRASSPQPSPIGIISPKGKGRATEHGSLVSPLSASEDRKGKGKSRSLQAESSWSSVASSAQDSGVGSSSSRI